MTIIAEDCSHTQSLCAPPVSKKAFSKIGKAQDCYQIPSMGSGLPLHRKMKTAHALAVYQHISAIYANQREHSFIFLSAGELSRFIDKE